MAPVLDVDNFRFTYKFGPNTTFEASVDDLVDEATSVPSEAASATVMSEPRDVVVALGDEEYPQSHDVEYPRPGVKLSVAKLSVEVAFGVRNEQVVDALAIGIE